VEFGQVRERIVTHAAETPADLIVLGAHHHSHLAMHLRTGPAFHVIQAARCPVLTVSCESASTLFFGIAPCDEQLTEPPTDFKYLSFSEAVVAQVDTFKVFGRWHSADSNTN
jgi:hypothetical protein